MRRLTRLGLVASIVTMAAVRARANDCDALLQSLGHTSIYVTMVTLNANHGASFTETRLHYVKPAPSGPAEPPVRDSGPTPKGRWKVVPKDYFNFENPKFDFGYKVQTFNDRFNFDVPKAQGHIGLPGWGQQGFDMQKADDLDIEITETSPPRVTLTLRSWGNSKIQFTPTCAESGFMLGSAGDAGPGRTHFVLKLKEWPPPH